MTADSRAGTLAALLAGQMAGSTASRWVADSAEMLVAVMVSVRVDMKAEPLVAQWVVWMVDMKEVPLAAQLDGRLAAILAELSAGKMAETMVGAMACK